MPPLRRRRQCAPGARSASRSRPGWATGCGCAPRRRGGVGPGGGPAGDLYVEVHEAHDVLVRDGDDLHCTVSVPMVDAALGTAVTVTGILGDDVEIVAPDTQPGAVHTLRGQGMPRLRSEARGDLHAHIEVMVPLKLDARTRSCSPRSRAAAASRPWCGPPAPPAPHQAADCSAGCGTPSAAADLVATLFYVEAVPAIGAPVVVDGDGVPRRHRAPHPARRDIGALRWRRRGGRLAG